ncbi:MAG: sulfatase-like hydrolase/transferase [Anaerolineaceae bacterium]|nr:sulfatase-like hydrolase/transferase [Anaerolineaceae bacterium]
MNSKSIGWPEKFPLYPLLVGLFPVLELFLFNIHQIPSYAILRALIVSVVVTILVWGACLIIFRNRVKAALSASLVLILVFSYGHVYDLLYKKKLLGITIGRHEYLIALWAAFILAGFVLLFRAHYLDNLNRVVYVFSAALIVLNLAQIAFASIQISSSAAAQINKTPAKTQENSSAPANTVKRDVYYIIVDSHSRSDVLKSMGYDNSKFISQLTDLGFSVLPCAQSNYTNTERSLSSSLNMNYLPTFGIADNDNLEGDVLPIASKLMVHSKVRQIFEQMGYQTVAFATKAPWANWTDADHYFNVANDTPVLQREETQKFYEIFLDTTLFRVVIDSKNNSYIKLDNLPTAALEWIDPTAGVFSSSRYQEYLGNVYSLTTLAKVPQLVPGPKFVIAHLMVTHSSLVFNRDGSFKPKDEEDTNARAAFLDAAYYADGQLPKIAKAILDQYPTVKPIIVIQADHGWVEGTNRVKILNALYLPDGGSSKLYPTLTPVNTFRLILDTYFGGNYSQLDNRSLLGVSDHYSEQLPVVCP